MTSYGNIAKLEPESAEMRELPNPVTQEAAEGFLAARGLDEPAVCFVLDQLGLGPHLGNLSAPEILLEHAARYVKETGVARLHMLEANLSLVVPPFRNGQITDRYLGALDGIWRSGPSEAERVSACRSLLLEATVRDFLELGLDGDAFRHTTTEPSSHLVKPDVLEKLTERLQSCGEAKRDVAGERRPGELAAALHGADLFADLDGVLLHHDRALRTHQLPHDERIRQQFILCASKFGADSVRVVPGRALTLAIEVDAPPPVAQRVGEDFPAVTATVLAALPLVWPQRFKGIRTEVDLAGAAHATRRSSLGEVAIGGAQLDLLRYGGVLDMYAEAARKPLDSLLGGRGDG